MISAVNYQYYNNGIIFFDRDGGETYKTFKELGYPYFYGIPDTNKKFTDEELSNLVSTKKMELNILTPDGIIQRTGYKVSTKTPQGIRQISDKFKVLCEANIPYIRRLAVDGVIQWDKSFGRYADIDIEELKGEIKLIGYQDNVDNEYIPLYSAQELVDYLEKNKTTTLFAWNGDGYDFERIKATTQSRYYNMMLKLDAMKMYKIFAQKSYRTLNQAGIDTGVGEKVTFTKPFQYLTQQELEDYNKQDVLLQKGIMDKTGIRNLIPYYTNYVMLNAREVSAIRVVDNIMMHRFKETALLLDKRIAGIKKKYEGGYVIEPTPNIYYNVASLDTNSLYPHVVMYENFEGKGAFIYKIIKQFETEIYNLRVSMKAEYNKTQDPMYNALQQMFKILMNGSFYGVFGNVYYRYEDKEKASFITERARGVLKSLVEICKKYGYGVIYGDTDSIFVEGLTEAQAHSFLEIINREIAPYEVKLEKYFKKMIIF